MELRTDIYTIESVQLWCSITTPSNPKGIAAITLTSQPTLVALPGHSSKGTIFIHDVSKEEGSVLEIEAHQAPLAALAWNEDGTLLASASVKGTVIRVHRPQDGSKAFTFR